MARVLVIPDVHLKPVIFDYAEAILKRGLADMAVQLGDIADDWDMGLNLALYEQTFKRALKFAKDFPETVWCWGNHDMSYISHLPQSGYSSMATKAATEGILKLYDIETRVPRVAYHLDKCVFSHAGILESFVDSTTFRERPVSEDLKNIDNAIDFCTSVSHHMLWEDDSPLWARLTPRANAEYKQLVREGDYTYVVGHTPVKHIVWNTASKVIFTDTFSTYSDGSKLGDGSMLIIDTENPDGEHALILKAKDIQGLMK